MLNTLETSALRPSFKPSNLEWLGSEPSGWETIKLGALLKPVTKKNSPDLPLLSITREQGVIVRDTEDLEANHNFIPDDLSNYKVIESGQFGMNKMKAWQGSYGVSEHTGIISPAYYVFNFTRDVVPRFFHTAIRSRVYVSYFYSASDGVRIGQWDLSKPRMKEIPFLLPPPSEQEAIADFLDDKTARIDEAIGIKEKQISLLKERKQILIQEAVLRGLNPNAPMKDSGVDWIGKIPAHWSQLANKYIFSLRKSQVGKRASEYELLSLTLKGIIKRDMDNPEGKFPAEFDTYQPVTPGDFVFCLFDVEETPRTVGVSPFFGMITGAYTVLRPSMDINSEYLHYLYFFLDKHKMLRPLYKGLRNTIPKDNFFRFESLVPPREEQDAIVYYLDLKSNEIDKAIERLWESINKLKEYKASLTDSAVTGKIKVV